MQLGVRKLTHLKGRDISFTRTVPSSNSLVDGDILFVNGKGKGRNLRLYAKHMGKLWYVPLLSINNADLTGDLVDTETRQILKNKTIVINSGNNVPYRSGDGTTDASIHIVNQDNSHLKMSYDNDSYVMTSVNSSADLLFSPNGTEKLRLTAAGNLKLQAPNPILYLGTAGNYIWNDALNQLELYGQNDIILNPVDDIYFQSGGSTKMYISNDGNVGIGTTNPDEKLKVDGNIKFSADRFLMLGGSSNKVGIDGANVGWHFHVGDGTERVTFLAGGNVGIGTTSPATKLEILNGATNQLRLSYDATHYTNMYCQSAGYLNIDNSHDRIIFGTDNDIYLQGDGNIFNVLGASGVPSYSFSGDANTGMWSSGADALNFSTGGSERMRIDSSGNVGIGTTSPVYPMQIEDGGSNAVLKFGVDSGNAGRIFSRLVGSGTTYQELGFYANDIRFATATSDEGTASATRMFIENTTGNVGIGTTSPDAQLTVSGGEGEDGIINLWADDGDDNQDKMRLRNQTGDLGIESYESGAWVNLLKVDYTGRVSGTSLKDESDMASASPYHIASQKSIKAYVDTTQFYSITGGFNYGYGAGTKVWIPLSGSSLSEISGGSTTGYPEYVNFIAPYDGTLTKVIFRSEQACGSTVVGFHLGSGGNEMPSTTATQSVTVDMTTDDTSYEFAFTSSNTFSKGQIIGISFDPTNDANDTAFTVVFKFDTTT